MVKVAEDVQIKYDETIRNSAGNILQFRYGNHSFDPIQSVILKDDDDTHFMFFANIEREVHRMNYNFEKKGGAKPPLTPPISGT
jgi:hypothetical protein